MSIPSKTTIDNLPPSVSERYAANEISIKTKFYQEIASPLAQARPQVAVLAPIQESQLEQLTGFLGKTHSLALYQAPSLDLTQDVFTHTVFPAFLDKDRTSVMEKLEALKTEANSDEITKILQAITTISDLNQMGSSAFARCRQLKQG